MKTKTRHFFSLAAFVLAALSTFSFPPSTISLSAAVLTVTLLADSGPGSLRDQVALSSSGDTIQFAVSGAILLNSAISIPHNLTIQGPGPSSLIVDAGFHDRAFVAAGNPVLLSGMTITHGLVLGLNGPDATNPGQNGGPGLDAYGGAILDTSSSSDLLILSNCWVTENVAQGGQGGRGGDNPAGAAFTPGNGGAGGKAWGGAVFAGGYLTIVNCTFSFNRAVGGGGGSGGTNDNPAVTLTGGTGGLGGDAEAGAVFDTVQGPGFTNATFSGNLVNGGAGAQGGDSLNGAGGQGGNGGPAGGGAIRIFLYGSFASCTIVSNSVYGGTAGPGGNGGPPGASGTSGSGTAGGVVGYTLGGCLNTIGNTILADNFASTVDSNYLIDFDDLGYNFIGSADWTACPWGAYSVVGTVTTPIHPQLGPLAQNGGGLPTHATTLSSPVTDQGYSFGLATDERGAPRPYDFISIPNASGGDGSDSGAFELGSSDLGLDVVSNNVVLTWPAYYGDFTLQSATKLQGSTIWTDVPDAPVVVGSQLVVTNPATNSMTFYRLISH